MYLYNFVQSGWAKKNKNQGSKLSESRKERRSITRGSCPTAQFKPKMIMRPEEEGREGKRERLTRRKGHFSFSRSA